MRLAGRRSAGLAAAVVILGAGVGLVVTSRHRPRSIEATVADYFAARRDGDCERLVDLVSDADATQGGRLDRGELVDRCADVVDDFRPELDEVEVLSVDGDRAVVGLSVVVDDRSAPFARPDGDGFVVTEQQDGEIVDRLYQEGHLTRENGAWRVETGLGAPPPGSLGGGDGACLHRRVRRRRLRPPARSAQRGSLVAGRGGHP
jgi:hypothetical protein